MFKPYLIAIGFTIIIFVPIMIGSGFLINIVMKDLKNNYPDETNLIQNQINNFFGNIISFIVCNSFYILVLVGLFSIVIILYFIWLELWYKNTKIKS